MGTLLLHQPPMPSVLTAPGAYQPLVDRWGTFAELAPRIPDHSLVLLDARVGRLHPRLAEQARRRARVLLPLTAGERAKSSPALDRVIRAGLAIPRSGWVVCIGGGTLGDLATVAAHLLKRGLRLIHVPSTLLAAVDSSVGGKGALHSGGAAPVKNALGVFHYPDECWICPELFSTLAPKQLREGRIEAWKMVICLSAPLWERYRRSSPALNELIHDARALKAAVCEKDPYEHQGLRAVLNFGHTFGHVIESVTGFRTSHGDAVGLGMLCALDAGRHVGTTSAGLAAEVERVLVEKVGTFDRRTLARAFASASAASVARLLAADKKAGPGGDLRMVLLARPGEAEVRPVPPEVWMPLMKVWKRGSRT